MSVIFAQHRFRERRELNQATADVLLVHGTIFGDCLMTHQAWSLYRSLSNKLSFITVSHVDRGMARDFLPEMSLITTSDVHKHMSLIT